MNIAFGIISYLPDNQSIRTQRFNKLKNLINTCNELFGFPIFIIIQNYKEEEILYLKEYKNVVLSQNYMRCGIVLARKKLREWLLSTTYDGFIFLDDDCVIKGNKVGANNYLKQIKQNLNCFGEFKGSQLKLFYISKEILSEVDFEDISPENGDGFEDTVFVAKLRNHYLDKRFQFSKTGDLVETSIGTKDALSTWYTNQDLRIMLAKTTTLKGIV